MTSRSHQIFTVETPKANRSHAQVTRRYSMNRAFLKIVIILVILVALVDSSLSAYSVWAAGCPNSIPIVANDLYPTSIAYDAIGARFLVGSLTSGTITAIKDDGTMQAFVEDAALLSTATIKVDSQRKHLLITNNGGPTNGNDALGKIAGLGIYYLLTGKQIASTDLSTA